MNLLLDHNMSPHIARGLHVLFNGEHRVVALKDYFGRSDLPDTEWIGRLGKEGNWCFISEDIRITKNEVERQAFLSARLVDFFLAPAVRKAPLHRKTARLLFLWDNMERVADSIESGLLKSRLEGPNSVNSSAELDCKMRG